MAEESLEQQISESIDQSYREYRAAIDAQASSSPAEATAVTPSAEPTPEPETPASKVILDRWPTPVEKATTEFERHAGRLLPGVAAKLGTMMGASLGVLAPDRRAEAVAEFLDSATGKRWLDPEASTANMLPNGQPASPLRQALNRYAAELKPGAIDALVVEWSVSLAGRSPAKLAGEVVKRLGQPENAVHLRQPIDKLYEHAFNRGGGTSTPAKATPVRQLDGRFAEPPAKPKRAPSSF